MREMNIFIFNVLYSFKKNAVTMVSNIFLGTLFFHTHLKITYYIITQME